MSDTESKQAASKWELPEEEFIRLIEVVGKPATKIFIQQLQQHVIANKNVNHITTNTFFNLMMATVAVMNANVIRLAVELAAADNGPTFNRDMFERELYISLVKNLRDQLELVDQ